MAPTLPTITLDQTLFDLYSLDGGNGHEVGFVMAVPPPGPQVAPSFPKPVKYAYQSPRYPKLDNDIYARICLGSAAQYHAFQTGPIPLYLFDVEPPKSGFFAKLVIARMQSGSTLSLTPLRGPMSGSSATRQTSREQAAPDYFHTPRWTSLKVAL